MLLSNPFFKVKKKKKQPIQRYKRNVAKTEIWRQSLGGKRKEYFVALPDKGGHIRLMPSKLFSTLERLVRSLTVFKEPNTVSS